MKRRPRELAAMDELLAFLPLFEVEGFEPVASWTGGEASPGVDVWPHPNYRDEVDRFMRAANRAFWRDRNYLSTDVHLCFEEPTRIAEAGLGEIKTLITFIVRGERFCDGHVGAMIEAGQVQLVLRRLAELRAADGSDDAALETPIPIRASFLSFEVERTYGGLLEGSREQLSDELRETLGKDYPMATPNDGKALVLPEGPRLPDWMCKAYLESGYCFDDHDDGSRLAVCWFVEEVDRPIQEMVDELLTRVDWRHRAHPFSY